MTKFSKKELSKRRTDAAWRFWHAWTVDTPRLRADPPGSESELDRFLAAVAAKALRNGKSISWTSVNNARHGNTDLSEDVIEALETALNRRLAKSRKRVRMHIFGGSCRRESDKPVRKAPAADTRTVNVRTKADRLVIKLPPGCTSARLHETRKRRGGALEVEIRLKHR